jgi:hypothetical protein
MNCSVCNFLSVTLKDDRYDERYGYLRRLAAEQAGLVVTEVKTITNSEWLYYQWIHLTTYPKPGEPSSFWSPNHQERTLLQNRILRVLGLMHRYKINHLLTRFFDSLGLGDNFVFVLKKQ